MVLIRNLRNIFFIPELARKLVFTLAVLIVYRIGSYIPAVGVDVVFLKQTLEHGSQVLGGVLSYLDMVSAGSLSRGMLFALGISPYITASIIMQFMGFTVPYFEQLMKEGDYGYKIMNQYTRYLTLALSISYSTGYAAALEAMGAVISPGFGFRFVFVLSLTVASMFIMWMGEQISLMGIGNGSSMLIFASIVAQFPNDAIQTVNAVQTGSMHLFVAFFVLLFYLILTAAIVYLEKGERKIPVQYARRVVGRKVYGGQSSYIPFKINTSGVMPVIFASSFLQIPSILAGILQWAGLFKGVAAAILSTGWRTSFLYNLLQFGLIVFFTYFYTELVYNPVKLADQMKKSGGFVPGIRPGKSTADFFYYILTRVGLLGALYLGFLSVLPNLMYRFVYMPFFLTGTSLLIAVGVALEFASQVESYLIERRYEGFLSAGRMKNKVQ
ncbi:MAG: Protein translocase subunit SecY [candidate division TM6 bacterium GW2011_GWF2_43_17]|nr:MAG: Protein translocase subunit SecY [candidate division TM6 bacterium GW2011_GWF2_43_17]HAU30125.1 preprotein translocase subunit SecY [Candidatus Dependentiae bacterium]